MKLQVVCRGSALNCVEADAAANLRRPGVPRCLEHCIQPEPEPATERTKVTRSEAGHARATYPLACAVRPMGPACRARARAGPSPTSYRPARRVCWQSWSGQVSSRGCNRKSPQLRATRSEAHAAPPSLTRWDPDDGPDHWQSPCSGSRVGFETVLWPWRATAPGVGCATRPPVRSREQPTGL